MAQMVTKKDGSQVAFDEQKLKASIAAAAGDAGMSEDDCNKIADEVTPLVAASLEGQQEVTTDEIRDRAMAELEATHPEVAEAWRKYEESKS